MAGVQIRIVGANKAIKGLNAAQLKMLNLKPLWDKASIILEQSHLKTFKMGGRPKWKPSKRALQQHGETLQDTGYLMRSVTARSTESVRRSTGRSFVFGTRVKYARAHQKGYKPKKIPKRPFLGVHKEDIKKMEEVLTDDLNKQIRRAIR